MKLHQVAVGNISRRIRKASQVATMQDEPEPTGTAAEFMRKPAERERKWSRLFAVNTSGSPRLRGARKFTK